MNEMTVKEAKKLVDKLQTDIQFLLDRFEAVTEMKIRGLIVTRPGGIADVRVEVDL